jgi:hypothetical protein
MRASGAQSADSAAAFKPPAGDPAVAPAPDPFGIAGDAGA